MVQERGIRAPILEHVYRLLWENGCAKDLAKGLMSLPMMGETHGMEG